MSEEGHRDLKRSVEVCRGPTFSVVPNKQFGPHKCLGKYTLRNNFHYIHHKVWWRASGSTVRNVNLIPSNILCGS